MYNNQRIIKELKPYIPAADIFRIYEKEAGCAFLDSSLVNDLGRYSIIGRAPYLKLVKDGDTFTVNGKPKQEKHSKITCGNILIHMRIRMNVRCRSYPVR